MKYARFLFLLMLAGCQQPSSPLVGTWQIKERFRDETYTFKANGDLQTKVKMTPDAPGMVMNFTYSQPTPDTIQYFFNGNPTIKKTIRLDGDKLFVVEFGKWKQFNRITESEAQSAAAEPTPPVIVADATPAPAAIAVPTLAPTPILTDADWNWPENFDKAFKMLPFKSLPTPGPQDFVGALRELKASRLQYESVAPSPRFAVADSHFRAAYDELEKCYSLSDTAQRSSDRALLARARLHLDAGEALMNKGADAVQAATNEVRRR